MYDFFAFIGIFILVLLIVDIVLYLIFAYALYKLALKEDVENSWLSWVPILQLYILGKIIKTLKIGDYEISNIAFVLPTATIVAIAFSRMPYIGNLISLANYILVLIALNKLYKMYKLEQATLFTILSIFGFPIPFIFMYIKDNIETDN